jgi:hypothetical protein
MPKMKEFLNEIAVRLFNFFPFSLSFSLSFLLSFFFFPLLIFAQKPEGAGNDATAKSDELLVKRSAALFRYFDKSVTGLKALEATHADVCLSPPLSFPSPPLPLYFVWFLCLFYFLLPATIRSQNHSSS